MKEKYKYIFVVLLYKNMVDIFDLIKSIERTFDNYHIILVNSFFDEKTEEEALAIAGNRTDCSFLSVENRGYGAGNNAGIQYAQENFDFDFIIISNPDTIIKKFDQSVLFNPSQAAIYAPKIISKDYKRQNPNWAFHSDLLEYLQYIACKKENLLVDYFVIAILKFTRILYSCIADIFQLKKIKVGNAHGSFFIISKSALNILKPLYDSHMFLFYEEVYLGHSAFCNHIPIYYVKDIVVRHKEDGSMRLSNINLRKEAHKSVIYYYEHRK
jgi:GT2 family glycosyltransferase